MGSTGGGGEETMKAPCSTMMSSGGVAVVSGPPSATASSLSSANNGHCSISHGGGDLGPVMEIREMSGYCNSCIPPDKYSWNHGTPPLVTGPPASARHSAVYHPPVFYTPPPPPPAYSSSNPVPEWSCSPSTAETFSHFMYSHHQYPPPAPQGAQHLTPHDFNAFLGIPTSCYDTTDMMLIGTAPPPPPLPTGSTCEQLPLGQTHTLGSSFMCSTSTTPLEATPSTVAASITSAAIKEKPVTSELMSSSSVDFEDELEEEDDDDDDRQVISIEDDESSVESFVYEEVVTSSMYCTLCKYPASAAALSHQIPVSSSSQHCPSPQLAKILENIDDDELDISVCSGDIEIGGIEDEMIQVEQPPCKITMERVAEIVGVPVGQLGHGSPDGFAIFCSKCEKLVNMADSLQKQLESVLTTVRQAMNDSSTDPPHEEKEKLISSVTDPRSKPMLSTSTQTDLSYDGSEKSRIITICQVAYPNVGNTDQISQENSHENKTERLKDFLCQECGRTFECSRNLGKHLRRVHKYGDPDKIACSREGCTFTCSDKTALNVHMRVHTGEMPFYCGDCLSLFNTKSNLSQHLKSGVCFKSPELPSQPPPPGTEVKQGLFRCENCSLTFRQENRFQKHIENPRGCSKTKLYECDICGAKRSKPSELQKHQLSHSGTKLFPCDICGVAFTTRGNLTVHQRTHMHQKRFKCPVCDKGFTRNQTRLAHVRKKHADSQDAK